MFGNIYECTSCDFRFSNGWSHHAGGISLFCTDCNCHFKLCGKSEWGADELEELEFIQRTENGFVNTGIKTRVVSVVNNDSSAEGILIFRLLNSVCPTCSSETGLHQEFLENTMCKLCFRGLIKKYGNAIY